VGFLPLIWLSQANGWGLAGIWAGLSSFIGLRLMFGLWRTLSGRWVVPGSG
jgi:Na+-driven multidrug efflux pump